MGFESYFEMAAILAAWTIGGAWHLVWTLYEEQKTTGSRNPITIKRYRKTHPYKLEMGFLAALSALLLMWGMDQLNIGMAVACGYMGDSIAKKAMNSLGGQQ